MTTDPHAVPTTTTSRQRPAQRRMEPTRKIALAAGIAYLVTFAASIPQLKLFAEVIVPRPQRVPCRRSTTTTPSCTTART